MTKAVKKKHRRMKRSVRKTLGALFMASAILVAAIPADGLQAGTTIVNSATVKVDINNCNIPIVAENETIYTTGDGQYQFAYVSPKNASTNNRVAVVLGYNGGFLEGNKLVIPDTVDAYLKYSDNQGTSSGYAAVGQRGNFLFYKVNEPVYDEKGEQIYDLVPRVDLAGNPILDDNGVQIIDPVLRTQPKFYPCYYEDRAKWEKLELDEFYYLINGDDKAVSSGDAAAFALTTLSEVQRIQGAEVWYIGNQYIEAIIDDKGTESEDDDVPTGAWEIAGKITDPSQGIFAGQGNIRYLTVGDKLSGIGDYAFYGCSGMESIKLGNGLDTIGNSAFENCINMTKVDVDFYSRVAMIGACAFYNCQALQQFNVPISVTAIGDSAFEGCYAMKHIELCGDGANVSLAKIGPNAFKDCENLESITFPRTFTNEEKPIDLKMFEGCRNLKYISTANNIISFVSTIDIADSDPNDGIDTSLSGFEAFKSIVPETFYFEGLEGSPVHQMCTKENFAFSYLGKDLYEITVVPDKNQPNVKAVYRVNSSNQLVYTDIHEDIEDVELPKAIGPYNIVQIDSTTFQNKYNLKKITIPSSIQTIASEAFKGCYNLADVIFTEPINVSTIGEDAFMTQEVTLKDADGKLPTLSENPVLRFTGTVSYDCVPFQYAMDPSSNINYGSQKRTYIEYYSGWPTNLVVQYNPNTDKNELIDYPTFKDISSGTKYTTENYAYMTDDYEAAATKAVTNYNSNQSAMTDYEWQIINSALQIVLPAGIESIQSGLFVDKEKADNVDKTITAYSLVEVAGGERVDDSIGADGKENIKGGAFNGCTNLKAIYLMDGTTTIGDYAFAYCENLEQVFIPTSVTEIGERPFVGCKLLSGVDFQGSPNFDCVNSIIYQLDGSGNKQKIVEFLEGRLTGVVDVAEVAGVTEIAEEAFMNTKVSSVDLRESAITDVPEYAFANTDKLFAVYLPYGCKSISANAFKNSALQYLEVPGTVSYLDNDAFTGVIKEALTFYCEDDSNAKLYADKNGINTTSKPIELYFTVKFWDYDNTLLDTQTVAAGQDAVPPTVPGREGYIHTGWVPDYHNIQSDMQLTAQYEAEDPDAKKFTVTFVDWDETVLKTTLVLPGGDAEAPVDPSREGYNFTGWRPAVTNIQGNTTIYAQYEKKDSTESQFTVRFIDWDDTVLYTLKVNAGEDAILPAVPGRPGYTFTGWRPAVTAVTKDIDTYAQYVPGNGTGGAGGTDGTGGTGGTGGGNGTGNGTGSSNGISSKLYTLTVQNGSGSGSYGAGTQPIIIANDPATGMEFDYWSISPTDTKIASKVLTATVVTMPEGDVTVTAHYKARTGGSWGTGSGNTTNRPNNGSTINSGGTTVVIDKNGLSNTGVVSATVNGSSDNFTIKISESEEAAEAAIKALMAEYGDISNIKYFPMDISLYDESGKKKITDTTGLSIKITLPLPDSLIAYAGNNKVAGIVNDRLDKLNAKFTTISGVSCITFTAEHFSPYVIYVDTGDLTAGSVEDSTPKTGDGIHPKWFLSIGLACISIVLFMKRDRRTLQKARA